MSPKPQPIDVVVKDVLGRAAVIGPFDPLDLLPQSLDPGTTAAVLRELGRSSEEVVVGGTALWRLKPEERQRILAGLSGTRAARRLVEKAKAPANDPFGRALQAALVGRDTATLPEPADLEAAYSARSLAATVPFAAKRKTADAGQVSSRIATIQEEKRRRIVLPHGLYGRKRVRTRIDNFIRGKDASAGTYTMLVTGIGGIGKSALLTSILSDADKDPTSPPVIVLDFDRPNLYRCDRIEIAREITRQLGRHVPRLEQALHNARDQFPSEETTTEQSLYLRQQDKVLSLMQAAIQPAAGKKDKSSRPAEIAVFLDTFEEVIARGAQTVRDTLDWFDTLRVSGGLGNMRLLVSGRSPPDLPKEEMAARFGTPVNLAGLSPAAGARLLREDSLGEKLFTPDKARQASEALSGHPQALRLLKLYSKDHPDTIDETIRDGLQESSFGIEFAQVFLYTRILGRIDDKEIAQLAHPGLMLRRVTPTLICEVLAGPCGFSGIDEAKAKDLFRRLSETWVVDRTDQPDVVIHKRELRRLMLPAMMNPKKTDARQTDTEHSALRERAIEISRLAAAWYGDRRDEKLAPQFQDIEAFYHRAMAEPGNVTVEEVTQYGTLLGEDLVDLPPRVQAISKVVTGRSEAVTAKEAELLPDELRTLRDAQFETMALKQGDTSQVKRGVSEGPDTLKSTASSPNNADPPARGFAEAEELFGREIHAWWADNRMTEVNKVADRVFGPLWELGSHESVIESRQDPIYFAAWKGLLAKLVTGDWPAALASREAADHLRSLYSPRGRAGESAPMISPADLHVTAVALARRSIAPSGSRDDELAALLDESVDIWPLMRGPITSPFALRSQQLLRPDAAPATVSCRLLRLFTPPYAAVMLAADDPSHSAGTIPPEIGQLVSRLSGRKVSSLLTASSMSPGRAPLSTLDALANELGDVFISWVGRPDRYHEGRLDELANPILNALQSVAGDTSSLIQLVSIGNTAPIWPIEFEEDAIRQSPPRDTRRFLTQLIDMADQCGLLLELVAAAHQLAPQDTAISELLRLVDRVEMIFHHRMPPA